MNSTYFIKLSGFIPENKCQELTQSYRFVQSSLPDDCIEFYLSSDLLREGYYHFLALWSSEAAMNDFLHSPGYDFLQGAFITLGNLEDKSNGVWTETKLNHKMN